MKRLIGALFLAFAVVLLCLFVVARLAYSRSLGPLPEMLVLLAAPIAAISIAVLGIPLALLARRMRWLRWSHFAVGGAAISLPLVVGTALSSPGGSVEALNGSVIPVIVLASSVAAAILAWALGVRRNESL